MPPMPYFFARLLPKRPDFPANMTAEEGATMQAHGAFLGEQLAKGTLVVAGPVLDPSGVFGLGIFEANTLDEVRTWLERDPATAVGHYQVVPMGPTVARKNG